MFSKTLHELDSSTQDGWYIIDKPSGITSAQAISRIKYQLRSLTGQRIKVGHMGTLDPLATGILPVGIGKYTKSMDFILKQRKTYVASIKLSYETTTEDLEGTPTISSRYQPSLQEIQNHAKSFTGVIKQIPSSFSAVKINGKRAYEHARKNIELFLEPRTVTVYSIKVDYYQHPNLLLTIECGSGVYIRAIARDLCRACGSAGHLAMLRRTRYWKWRC